MGDGGDPFRIAVLLVCLRLVVLVPRMWVGEPVLGEAIRRGLGALCAVVLGLGAMTGFGGSAGGTVDLFGGVENRGFLLPRIPLISAGGDSSLSGSVSPGLQILGLRLGDARREGSEPVVELICICIDISLSSRISTDALLLLRSFLWSVMASTTSLASSSN